MLVTLADLDSFVRRVGGGPKFRFFCVIFAFALVVLFYRGEWGSYNYSKRATFGPPAKRH